MSMNIYHCEVFLSDADRLESYLYSTLGRNAKIERFDLDDLTTYFEVECSFEEKLKINDYIGFKIIGNVIKYADRSSFAYLH